jgi:hypothetical protein
MVSSYAYNGLGDRLQQTVDSVTKNYSLDLNGWLSQMLADEPPYLPYANCTQAAVWCNRGATGIEIIDKRETIDIFTPHEQTQ